MPLLVPHLSSLVCPSQQPDIKHCVAGYLVDVRACFSLVTCESGRLLQGYSLEQLDGRALQ